MCIRDSLQAYRHTPIISVSESSKKELLSLSAYENISVINNGIDITAYKQVSGMSKTPQPTLVYLGRLKKYKRVDHVIKAYKTVHATFPESKLIIVGKGDDEPRLRKLVSELKLDSNIEFAGFVSEEEKVKILASSWVSAIASEKEGWGIGVIESNAAGTPVAGYKVPGLEDSIKDSYSGFLVENGKINLLAEKIELLFKNNELRKELSANSIEWANRFSWDAAASQFYAKLNEIIAEFYKK
jgi:glycosyltransferase involved in cell wall biosynthesis